MAYVQSNRSEGGRYLQLDVWEKSWNPANNSSLVGWKLSSIGGDVRYYQIAPTTVIVDGAQVYYKGLTLWTDKVFPAAEGSVEGEVTIPHDPDGTKSITFSLSTRVLGSTPETTSGSLDLTSIPLASVIKATDANIGSVSTITVIRNSNTYTHTIKYVFGALKGYLTASGGISSTPIKLSKTSIPFTVPDEFYEQVTDAKSGVCTLICSTYSGSTKIGEDQTGEFTAYTVESVCAPVVSGSVVDVDHASVDLTGDSNKLIRYVSTARCTITATARKGATIERKTLNGSAIEGSVDIEGVELTSFDFLAVDSRGYSKSSLVSPEIVPYVKLTANVSITRGPVSGNTAEITVKGNYYNGSFGSEENSLVVRYMVAGVNTSYVPLTPVISGNTYEAIGTVEDVSYDQSYSVTISVYDRVPGEIIKNAEIRKATPVFDWGESDFQFNVPVYFQGKDLLDTIYPVGSIYMSVNKTSPATLFGGTWEQLKDRFLLSAGDTYSAGDTGGSATVALSESQIPKHYHNIIKYWEGGSTVDTSKFPSWAMQVKIDSVNNVSTPTTGTNGGTGYVGGSQAHNNMPPYLTVYMWKRTD